MLILVANRYVILGYCFSITISEASGKAYRFIFALDSIFTSPIKILSRQVIGFAELMPMTRIIFQVPTWRKVLMWHENRRDVISCWMWKSAKTKVWQKAWGLWWYKIGGNHKKANVKESQQDVQKRYLLDMAIGMFTNWKSLSDINLLWRQIMILTYSLEWS